jgi:hypothetical protein
VTVYQVTGRRAYREHMPGSVFESMLDPAAETRALARGDIEILERSLTTIRPGSYRLPTGWTRPQKQEA